MRQCELVCQKDYRSTQKSLATLENVNSGNRAMCLHYSCAAINHAISSNPDECDVCWQQSDLRNRSNFEGFIGYDFYGLIGIDIKESFVKDNKQSTCKIMCNEPYFWSGKINHYARKIYKESFDRRCYSTWCKESRVSDRMEINFAIDPSLLSKHKNHVKMNSLVDIKIDLKADNKEPQTMYHWRNVSVTNFYINYYDISYHHHTLNRHDVPFQIFVNKEGKVLTKKDNNSLYWTGNLKSDFENKELILRMNGPNSCEYGSWTTILNSSCIAAPNLWFHTEFLPLPIQITVKSPTTEKIIANTQLDLIIAIIENIEANDRFKDYYLFARTLPSLLTNML